MFFWPFYGHPPSLIFRMFLSLLPNLLPVVLVSHLSVMLVFPSLLSVVLTLHLSAVLNCNKKASTY